MRSDEAVLVSIYTAGEVSESENWLDYQRLHNLIFYLVEVEKMEFMELSNYSFSPFLWGKAGNALISRQLAKEVGTLHVKGYLIVEGGRTVSISPLGIQVAQKIISGLSQWKVSKFKRGVDNFLKEMQEDSRACFQKCLRAYAASYTS